MSNQPAIEPATFTVEQIAAARAVLAAHPLSKQPQLRTHLRVALGGTKATGRYLDGLLNHVGGLIDAERKAHA